MDPGISALHITAVLILAYAYSLVSLKPQSKVKENECRGLDSGLKMNR
jgi:hypothetical protein